MRVFVPQFCTCGSSRCCQFSGPVLRDTTRLSQRYPPSLRAMGFLVSQHGLLGAMPPPPFLSISPLESMRNGHSDTCAIPYENKANGCDAPLCDTLSKGYCAIWGGISHWAAKSDTAANANANSDAPRKVTGEFLPPNLKEEAAN